ncbi:MAG: PrsW family intramembrane metalloprotease [Erysipelotrichaceae bacterium]|nr:PrsW family intramembrane metalloprotease [Erysipelotrichaceae bacterium]
MFYYYYPIGTFNIVLIAAAIIPALFLMIRIYKIDHLEKESGPLLRKLVVAGILSSLIALVEERVLSYLLANFVSYGSLAYNVILYFVVVAVSEESSKYLMLFRNSWNTPEFNCVFDGVVYAVFVSLGFALWENISYVLNYGIYSAFARALTAIPGHACFGVFMGVFYSAAKKYERYGDISSMSICRFMAILVPVLLHGSYDFIATMETDGFNYVFIIFVAILFIASNLVVKRVVSNDHYM